MKSFNLPVKFILLLSFAIIAFSPMKAQAGGEPPDYEICCWCVSEVCGFIDIEVYYDEFPEEISEYNVGEYNCNKRLTHQECRNPQQTGISGAGQPETIEDIDGDRDRICDSCDNCPDTPNGLSENDLDDTDLGDFVPDSVQQDTDHDEIGDVCDNCPLVHNQDQDASACADCPQGTSRSSQVSDTARANTPGAGCSLSAKASGGSPWVWIVGLLSLSLLLRKRTLIAGIFAFTLVMSVNLSNSYACHSEIQEAVDAGCCICGITECRYDDGNGKGGGDTQEKWDYVCLFEARDGVAFCPEEMEQGIKSTGECLDVREDDSLSQDSDGDGFCDQCDNCPSTSNGFIFGPDGDSASSKNIMVDDGNDEGGQDDMDNDGVGDVCDACPLHHNPANDPSDCSPCAADPVPEPEPGDVTQVGEASLQINGAGCGSSLLPNVPPNMSLILGLSLLTIAFTGIRMRKQRVKTRK